MDGIAIHDAFHVASLYLYFQVIPVACSYIVGVSGLFREGSLCAAYTVFYDIACVAPSADVPPRKVVVILIIEYNQETLAACRLLCAHFINIVTIVDRRIKYGCAVGCVS